MKNASDIQKIVSNLVTTKLQVENCQTALEIADNVFEGKCNPLSLTNFTGAVNHLILEGLQTQINLLLWVLDGDRVEDDFPAGGLVGSSDDIEDTIEALKQSGQPGSLSDWYCPDIGCNCSDREEHGCIQINGCKYTPQEAGIMRDLHKLKPCDSAGGIVIPEDLDKAHIASSMVGVFICGRVGFRCDNKRSKAPDDCAVGVDCCPYLHPEKKGDRVLNALKDVCDTGTVKPYCLREGRDCSNVNVMLGSCGKDPCPDKAVVLNDGDSNVISMNSEKKRRGLKL